MTIERYRKSINLHAVTGLVIGSVSLVFCALTQFSNIFAVPRPDSKIQLALAFLVVLIAVIQYLYTRNILKKRLLSIVNMDSLAAKVDRYHNMMLQSFYLSAFSLVAMAVLCLFVDNTMLVCLEGLVLLFSVMLLKPSAYRLKMDLDLPEAGVAKIYGNDWDK